MGYQLVNGVAVVRCLGTVAAGTSTQTGTTVDTAGFEGAMFVASFGTITAGSATTFEVQAGALADGSDKAALAAANKIAVADTDDATAVVIDIRHPLDTQRYLTPVVVRATQNAVIDSVFCFLYHPRKEPVVQGATVSHTKIAVSPAYA